MSVHSIQVTSVLHANGKFTVGYTGTGGQQSVEIPDTGVLAYAQQGITPIGDEQVLQAWIEQTAPTDPDFQTIDSLAGKTLSVSDLSVTVTTT